MIVLKLLKSEQKIYDNLGIKDISEMLFIYPFRYDNNEIIAFEDWKLSDKVFFNGVLLNRPTLAYFNRRSSARFQVQYDDQILNCTIFNRRWIAKLEAGSNINIEGKYTGNNKVTVSNYTVSDVRENVGMFSVYHLSAGSKMVTYRKLMKKVYDLYSDDIIDDIPVDLKNKYRLLDLKVALKYIHFPESFEQVKLAERTLKYREFLKFSLAASLRVKQFESISKTKKQFDMPKIEQLIATLNFELTNDQMTSLNEIFTDLKNERIMNRLLQGDVGSGKTIVAALAMYANVLAGKQSAFMAPTELLVIQQGDYLKSLFSELNIEVTVLYSAMSNLDKQIALANIESGKSQIIVGTHSLFQDDTNFANLGFVVIDEQQRFGVNQRTSLFEKGFKTDRLLMSATPIPRTMASIIFADMDISTIKSMPNSRKQIKTKLINQNSMKPILDEIINHVHNKRQVYVVCPAIEDDTESTLTNVDTIYKSLNIALNDINKLDFKVAKLHGKQSAEIKAETMQLFLDGDYDILVSTTVIEVGIDNPNANVMIIYDANSFGLSQLHQLRGRVGRGTDQAYCYLLNGSKDEEAIKKLEFIENNTDGFAISEYDLKMRGPGDVIGIRQSGIPNFVLGDLQKDIVMLNVAKDDAKAIINDLENPDYRGIIDSVQAKII